MKGQRFSKTLQQIRNPLPLAADCDNSLLVYVVVNPSYFINHHILSTGKSFKIGDHSSDGWPYIKNDSNNPFLFHKIPFPLILFVRAQDK